MGGGGGKRGHNSDTECEREGRRAELHGHMGQEGTGAQASTMRLEGRKEGKVKDQAVGRKSKRGS